MDAHLQSLYEQLAALAAVYKASRLVLFGSRARGEAKHTSDIDLAVFGMPTENQGAFWMDAEELETLLKLDLVHIRPDTDTGLLRNIEQEGIILYEKSGKLPASLSESYPCH